jgi:TM2 domain-containing membrane protein YozV
MSEENNNDTFDNAKDSVENAAEKIGEGAKEAAGEIKEEWNQVTQSENKKMIAGILAIVIGLFGIHKFILGYTQEGILTIVISIVTCGIGGQIIGLIEGIIYLTKSDEEFYQTYQANKKGWF